MRQKEKGKKEKTCQRTRSEVTFESTSLPSHLLSSSMVFLGKFAMTHGYAHVTHLVELVLHRLPSSGGLT